MNLEQALRNALDRIRSGRLANANEVQVRHSVIVPILRALEWDDTNLDEFVPEYPVVKEDGKGSVDFALFRTSPSRLPLVFVETKRLGGLDVTAEGQLFRYANNQGVPFLVLTDGNVWNFYLAMAVGTPTERVVYRAELRQEEKLSEYAEFFKRYLGKENILSGKAKQDAESDKESEANRLTAQNAIPYCWQGMLSEPNGELLKMLVDAVERNCGIRPDPDDVKAFLGHQHSIAPTEPTQLPRPSLAPIDGKDVSPRLEPRRSTIAGFVLDGKQRPFGNGIKTLEGILIEFQKRDRTFMTRLAPNTTRRNRRLVSQNRDDIYENENLRERVHNLQNGWWLATNLNTKTIEQTIRIACEVAGIGYGTDLVLLEGPNRQTDSSA